jgi:hypothetical protein
VLEAALAEEAADGQVHGVVGGDHVHAPQVDLLVEQPFADAVMRAGVALDVALFVAIRAEERILVPAGVDEENVAVVDLGFPSRSFRA